MLIFYIQHRKLITLVNKISDSEQQLTAVSSDIIKVRENLIKLKQINSENVEMLDQSILYLDNAALLLGHPHDVDGDADVEDTDSDVCPEEYLGVVDWPYHYDNWRLATEDCTPGASVSDLVTIIMTADTMSQVDQVTRAVWTLYPSLPVIVETHGKPVVSSDNVRFVEVGRDLRDIVDMVTTKYVLWAEDLDYVSNWTNIERGVSLINIF